PWKSFGNQKSFQLCGEPSHPDGHLMNFIRRDANEIVGLLENDLTLLTDRNDDVRFTGDHARVHGASGSFGYEVRGRFVVEELRDVVAEDELEVADRTVALLGDDDLGDPFLLGVLVVDLIAIDERDEIGVLLDRTRLAKVGQLRTVIAGALLRTARQLGKR